jgi:hypothetical protein
MNYLKSKYKRIIDSRKRSFWFSFTNAMLLLSVCYIADNQKYSILSGPSVGQRIEQFKALSDPDNGSDLDEYIFVNIAYDRQLVPVYDEYGFSKGVIDVTDRKKLDLFLNQLNNNHKYVLLDVLLSDKYKTEYDSLLITSLLNTERISISRSSTTNLIDERLSKIAGYTDYSTDIFETNFVKYEFIKDGKTTMPLMAYQKLQPHSCVYYWGPIYWSNWHFWWNSHTLRFPIKLWNNHINKDGANFVNFQEKRVLNLGADILDLGIDISTLVKDKIVVIGDFTANDIHDTYLGKIAGPIINLNAFEALRNNELEIPWSLIFFLTIFYVIISYLILRKPISLERLLDKLHMNRTSIKYVLSFIGYSFIFTTVSGTIYLICGIDIIILIPTIWFTILQGLTNKLKNL